MQLLPVVQQLAENETNKDVTDYYNKTIKLMEKSISALINLVSVTI